MRNVYDIAKLRETKTEAADELDHLKQFLEKSKEIDFQNAA